MGFRYQKLNNQAYFVLFVYKLLTEFSQWTDNRPDCGEGTEK
jgi:hypothetical protein